MSKVASAKTRGKLTKQELKQDKLVQWTYKIEQFYLNHQQWVIGAAIAVVVIVIGVVLARKMMESSRLEHSYQITMAKMSYGSGKLDDAKTAFEKIVSTMGGEQAAEGRFYLGRIAYDQGNFPEAMAQFDECIKKFDSNPQVTCSAISGLAAVYEVQDKQEDAAKTYESIADKYPTSPYAAQALMEAARVYLKINQNDKAIAAFKRVTNDYEKSAAAATARQKLTSLE